MFAVVGIIVVLLAGGVVVAENHNTAAPISPHEDTSITK